MNYERQSGGAPGDEAWRRAYDAIYGDNGRYDGRAPEERDRYSDRRAGYREPYQWNRADAGGYSGADTEYGAAPSSSARYADRPYGPYTTDRSYQMANRPNDRYQASGPSSDYYGNNAYRQSTANDYGRDQYGRQDRRNGNGYDRTYSNDYGQTQYGQPDRWADSGRNPVMGPDPYNQVRPLSPRHSETMSRWNDTPVYPDDRRSAYGDGMASQYPGRYDDQNWRSGRNQERYAYDPGQEPENQTWSDSGEMRNEAWEEGRYGRYGQPRRYGPDNQTWSTSNEMQNQAWQRNQSRYYDQPYRYREPEQRMSGHFYDSDAGLDAPRGSSPMAGNWWEKDRRGIYARQPMQGYANGGRGASGDDRWHIRPMPDAEKAAFGIDSDNDGFVSQDELGALAGSRFDRLDRDGNGELDSKEWGATGVGTNRSNETNAGSETSGSDQSASDMDANGDGKITREDFVKRSADAYSDADSDKDGKISIWEFRSHTPG
ncbi:MAG: hypothetical protein CMM50_05035 [Rhodospirillaceae bacterium]|nr:hypothetical protein [Rhodospirillaceae bacterium]